tara:strand:- start:294 stop:440 length:147 start_codon:yes stop_codon:yes gene_type:complete
MKGKTTYKPRKDYGPGHKRAAIRSIAKTKKKIMKPKKQMAKYSSKSKK